MPIKEIKFYDHEIREDMLKYQANLTPVLFVGIKYHQNLFVLL